MKRIKLVLVACLILVIVLSGQAMAKHPVLTLYTSLAPDEAKTYINAFTAENKVNVEWYRMSSMQVAEKLRSEAKHPWASIWFGAPTFFFMDLKSSDLFASYESPVGISYNPPFRDEQFYWYGLSLGALGFVYNTEFFERNKLAYPTSWNDLLKPELKSKISFAYPYTSGTGFTILVTVVTLLGEEKGFEYMKNLDSNVHHYNTAGAACVSQVGKGEVAVGITYSADILANGTSQGLPVKMVFPVEGTGYDISGVALINKAPDPELGKLFIDWLLSKKAQDLLKIWYRTPLHPEAELPENTIKPSEIKLVQLSELLTGQNQERLIMKWRELTGK